MMVVLCTDKTFKTMIAMMKESNEDGDILVIKSFWLPPCILLLPNGFTFKAVHSGIEAMMMKVL